MECTSIMITLCYYRSTFHNGCGGGFMTLNVNDSQSMYLLQKLSQKSKPIFTLNEAARIAQSESIQLSQLRRILSNLSKKGWVIRLRRGLYAGVGSLPNQAHINSFAIATHLVEPSAVSHWSALQYHGLTEQIPSTLR